MNRILKVLLTASAVLGLLIVAVAWWLVFRPLPKTSGTLRAPGLRQPVVVRRDALGVPHVRAQSLDDLYYAQGWVTAQDRLWQMDMLRRQASGTLAEVAGPAAYRSDADKRILGLRQAADAAASNLPPDQRRWLEAYAAGVNAFMASGPLPLEIRLMQYQPQPWTVADSMLVGMQMFHTLSTTWRDEFLKLMLDSHVGAERTADLLVTRSDRDHPPSQQVLASPPDLRRTRRLMPPAVSPPFHKFSFDLAAEALPPPSEDDALPGSNNWVVSGRHTASGRAMLANDPHLTYSVPAIWYGIHLEAPGGMNSAGVSLPGMPAVILGHNEHIAWGATNMGADVQDVYMETFDPKDPHRYLVDGQWRQVELRRESILVRGQLPVQFTSVLTRHGPLVLNLDKNHYSMRWVATERQPWTLPFFQVNRASNWDEFNAAFAGYPGPAQNFVYADAAGNIGYLGAGRIPIRPRGDGSVPLRGDDSGNDWTGYIPFDRLPRVYNPPSGIIVTANGRIVPDDYPYPVATKWEAPDRTERIYELLSLHLGDVAGVGDGGRKLRPDDFTRIQADVYSAHLKTLAEAFAGALEHRRTDARARQLAAQLRGWSGELWADSSEASLTQFARQEFLKELLQPGAGPAYVWYRWRMSTLFLENVIRERPARWLPPGLADYDEAMARSVERAARALAAEFRTEELRQWPWGRLMQTTFAHPVGSRMPGLLRSRFVAGPFRQSGNSYTVKQTTPTLGQSMRMVVDFGNLDDTLLTLPMGQSGHAFSSNFKDQFETWHKGGALKRVFSPAAVERATKATLTLVP